MIEIPKPSHRMKTVVKKIEDCLYFHRCTDCWHKGDKLCQIKLMLEGLYYLEMTLEKSEGK